MDCVWFIESIENGYMVLWFFYFHLETNADYLSVGKGRNVSDTSSIVLHLSGLAAPETVAFNDSSVWVRFVTDSFAQWWGFFIYVTLKTSDTFCKSLLLADFDHGNISVQ